MKLFLAVLISTSLLAGTARAVPTVSNSGFQQMGAGVSDLGQLEIGLWNFYAPLGESDRYGFYNKGRYLNFLILTDERKGGGHEIEAASYEALFPGFLVFGLYFSEHPENFGWIGNGLLLLLNGEIGVRSPWMTLGVTNGIHPFFTRRWYHDTGVRLGFGKSGEVGLTVFEQDRFDLRSVRYGLKLDVQGYIPF